MKQNYEKNDSDTMDMKNSAIIERSVKVAVSA